MAARKSDALLTSASTRVGVPDDAGRTGLVQHRLRSGRWNPASAATRSGDSFLVVSPHPDDESLCCGGSINCARRLGVSVAIVWVTNGDGFKWDAMVVEKKLRPRAGTYLDLARQRQAERASGRSRAGCDAVSLSHFLGYPDRGRTAPIVRLLPPEHTVALEVHRRECSRL